MDEDGTEATLAHEASPQDTGMTLVRDGELTPAGVRRDRYEAQNSRGHDGPVAVGGRPAPAAPDEREHAPKRARGRLPGPPASRAAIDFHVQAQSNKGKAASCANCMRCFAAMELRVTRSSDFRSGASRWLHISCCPGGFRPDDTFAGPDAGTAAFQDALRPRVASTMDMAVLAADTAPPVDKSRFPDTGVLCGDAWWSKTSWDLQHELQFGTMIEVPPRCELAYSELKAESVQACLESTRAALDARSSPNDIRSKLDSECYTQWTKLMFMDHLLLAGVREKGESQAECVCRRLRLARDGDWDAIYTEAAQPRPMTAVTLAQELSKQAALVRDLCHAGEQARALRCCKERRDPVRDPTHLPAVKRLFPQDPSGNGAPALTCSADDLWTEGMRRELGARIASLLRRPARRRASGRFGGRGEHWKVMRNIDGALEQTGELFALLALGLVPDEVMDNFVDAELIPTREPGKAKLRPLNLLPFPRRVSMSAVVKQAKAQIVAAVGPDQVAIGVPDGCTRIYCAASAQLRLDRSRVLLQEDCSSAHQSLDRKYSLAQYHAYAPMLCQPFGAWYGRPTTCTSLVAVARRFRASAASGRATPSRTPALQWPLSNRRVTSRLKSAVLTRTSACTRTPTTSSWSLRAQRSRRYRPHCGDTGPPLASPSMTSSGRHSAMTQRLCQTRFSNAALIIFAVLALGFPSRTPRRLPQSLSVTSHPSTRTSRRPSRTFTMYTTACKNYVDTDFPSRLARASFARWSLRRHNTS